MVYGQPFMLYSTGTLKGRPFYFLPTAEGLSVVCETSGRARPLLQTPTGDTITGKPEGKKPGFKELYRYVL